MTRNLTLQIVKVVNSILCMYMLQFIKTRGKSNVRPALPSPPPSTVLSGDCHQNEWVSRGKIMLQGNLKNQGPETEPQAGLKKMTEFGRG